MSLASQRREPELPAHSFSLRGGCRRWSNRKFRVAKNRTRPFQTTVFRANLPRQNSPDPDTKSNHKHQILPQGCRKWTTDWGNKAKGSTLVPALLPVLPLQLYLHSEAPAMHRSSPPPYGVVWLACACAGKNSAKSYATLLLLAAASCSLLYHRHTCLLERRGFRQIRHNKKYSNNHVAKKTR